MAFALEDGVPFFDAILEVVCLSVNASSFSQE
jgi:hypothetical protein